MILLPKNMSRQVISNLQIPPIVVRGILAASQKLPENVANVGKNEEAWDSSC